VISPQPAGFDFAAGSDYRHRLLDHIATYRRTAPFARGDLSGTVMVRFSLDRRGNVQEVSIAGSSGVSELDEEAVATIWRAQPMPPIPAVLPEVLSVTFPMWFGTAPRAPG
jgi:protein TonB